MSRIVLIPPDLSKEQVENTFNTILGELENFPGKEIVREILDTHENNPETVVEKMFDRGVITTSKDIITGRLTPKDIKKHYSAIIQTSGSTGEPKIFPFTFYGDGILLYEHGREILLNEVFERGGTFHSMFPGLPSSSGEIFRNVVEKLYLIDGVSYSIAQIPPMLLTPEGFPILVNRLKRLRPRYIAGLTTHVVQLLTNLPGEVNENVRAVIVGGEQLPRALAEKLFDTLPNLEAIFDVYGSSEFGVPAYAVITRNNLQPRFNLRTGIILAQVEEETRDKKVARIYITKIEPKNYPPLRSSPLGLYLINYDIKDYAILDKENRICSFFRQEDQVSLAGAKLNLGEIAEIAHKFDGIEDFILLYSPISASNQRPKAKIVLGYSKLSQGEDTLKKEFLKTLFEVNNPVNYEVNATKAAELTVELKPINKLREGLPSRQGKPQRLYVVE